ncbi:hypothetical protein QC762_0028010 [Podospora pseudocomata]|uniref:Uncharacterized protein n=1 Tax=Podospora pseudocomata TaxID=2093779 RepID=A0ABR0GRP6_9PEZI|nr:hypothetical protein QC762_0028010 [Podospora pseudocomata]
MPGTKDGEINTRYTHTRTRSLALFGPQVCRSRIQYFGLAGGPVRHRQHAPDFDLGRGRYGGGRRELEEGLTSLFMQLLSINRAINMRRFFVRRLLAGVYGLGADRSVKERAISGRWPLSRSFSNFLTFTTTPYHQSGRRLDNRSWINQASYRYAKTRHVLDCLWDRGTSLQPTPKESSLRVSSNRYPIHCFPHLSTVCEWRILHAIQERVSFTARRLPVCAVVHGGLVSLGCATPSLVTQA